MADPDFRNRDAFSSSPMDELLLQAESQSYPLDEDQESTGHMESLPFHSATEQLLDEDEMEEIELTGPQPMPVMTDDRQMMSPFEMLGSPTSSMETPPLPAIDYLRKIGSPPPAWAPLEPGLEVEAEGELFWPIASWSEVTQGANVISPYIELAGFKWYRACCFSLV